MAVEDVVPANALLLVIEFEMQWRQIVGGFMIMVWICVYEKCVSYQFA
jgi:hypothetical protein